MSKISYCKILLLSVVFSLPANVFAQAYADTMSIVSVSTSLIFGLCIIVGVLFVGMGLVRYQQHRQNPSETPLSRVLYVLFFGILMLVLPYIAQKAVIYNVINSTADEVTN